MKNKWMIGAFALLSFFTLSLTSCDDDDKPTAVANVTFSDVEVGKENSREAMVGKDLLFLYATAPESRLTFMMEVEQVDMRFEETVDDGAYFISQAYYDDWLARREQCRYVRYGLLKELSSPALTLVQLRAHGLSGAPRSPRRLGLETVDYIMQHLGEGC